MDRTRAERIANVCKQIRTHTRAARLICPLADQDLEIWCEREKWLDASHSLSLGIVTAARRTIRDRQFFTLMNAYACGRQTVEMSYLDAFHVDPVKEIKRISREPFFVALNTPIPLGPEYHKRMKRKVHQGWEGIRRKNLQEGVAFAQQLETEYVGELVAGLTHIRRLRSGHFVDEADYMNTIFGAAQLNQEFAAWTNVTGKEGDLAGLIGFYASPYYRAMPHTNIKCRLTARLLTDKQEVKTGDPADVDNTATLLPYSDLFITDKKMCSLITREGFAPTYLTSVCHLRDTKTIDKFFSALS
jgi:hypothetical protein